MMKFTKNHREGRDELLEGRKVHEDRQSSEPQTSRNGWAPFLTKLDPLSSSQALEVAKSVTDP